jgi:hypothetical protein
LPDGPVVAGFAAGRSLVRADKRPQADPVLLRFRHGAAAGIATHVTRRQGPSPRIKRPISKVVHHARYVTFQLAEVAVPRRLYRAILERIRRFAALSARAAPV